MLGNLLYAGAVIAFIYGGRSVIMGKHPMIQTGVAAGAASAILVTGLFVLVIGRTLASPRVSNLGGSGRCCGSPPSLTGQCLPRVEQQLSCSAMRYLRALAAMLDRPVVLAAEPELIGRLRALRERRQRLRALGRGSR
jgi:hypothetical protein